MNKNKREITSSLTHFAAAVMAMFGTVALTKHTAGTQELSRIVASLIFGGSMITLYTISSVYHWIDEAKARAKRIMQRVDHMAIFILIAGSYTPICVLTLGGPAGYRLLAAVWSVAALGFLLKIFWMGAPQWLSCGLYVLMGWMAAFAFPPLVRNMPLSGLLWLVCGGVIYTAGALIFGFEKPDIKLSWFGPHELFHLFVIGGSVCHYITIYRYVA